MPMYAASNGHSDVIKVLVQSRARVNDADERGVTALHLAAASGDFSSFSELLAAKASPHFLTEEGAGRVGRTSFLRPSALFASVAYTKGIPYSSHSSVLRLNPRWSLLLCNIATPTQPIRGQSTSVSAHQITGFEEAKCSAILAWTGIGAYIICQGELHSEGGWSENSVIAHLRSIWPVVFNSSMCWPSCCQAGCWGRPTCIAF
ncbi:unnamed protein product [Effrenium voratum]|nr:unnamed protein product [Effrenium voratum]